MAFIKANRSKAGWALMSLVGGLLFSRPTLHSRLGDEGRSEGQARRLGDPLRNSTRRGPRAMRDRAQRRRPGPTQSDSGRDRSQYRGSQDAPHAGHRAAWGAASPGVSLRIDNAEAGRLSFLQCLPNGCVGQLAMDQALIDKLKTGKTATLGIFQTPEEGVGVQAPLAGFKEAYEQLP